MGFGFTGSYRTCIDDASQIISQNKLQIEVLKFGETEPEWVEYPISEADLKDWCSGKKLIQEAMPNLSNHEREFLITGLTQKMWEEIMSEPEEDFED